MHNNTLDELYNKVTDLQKQVNDVVQEIEQLRTTQSALPAQPIQPSIPVLEAQSTEDAQNSTSDSSNDQVGEAEEAIPIVGRSGVFDGIFMITDDGKKFQVPPNYVSKSMLVVGDVLEIVEVDETGSKYSFKQTKNVERKEVEGILTKKDNQWAVHTDEGIYYVVAAAVRFHKADVGDVVAVVLPAQASVLPVEWAAFKEIRKQALREKFEPRAKQYMQPQEQEAPITTQESTPVVEPPQEEAAVPAVQQSTEIVKSRLSTPQAPPVSVVTPVLPQQPVEQEQVVGEVHVSPQQASEPQIGEITLHDEDLWELR